MSFLSPWSWLWVAPLLAAIILLHLLKLRRQPLVVSSVLLWNYLVADLQANVPFQKLRRSLLLLLQLLAAAALVAALARPLVRATGFEGQSIALILDASGSMQARDLRGTRFGAARRVALKAIDDLGRGDTLAIIAAGTTTRVVSPFTSDRRALAAAVNSLQCTDAPTRLDDALRLADALCTRKRSAQIVVLSDGAFPPLQTPLVSKARLTFARLGQRSHNLAITALGARRSLAGPTGYQVYVAAENFSPRSRTVAVELLREGRLLDARELTLGPGRPGAQVFTVPAAAGLVTARLDAPDDLEADNQASLFLSPPRQASVLLLSRGDLFLERALALDPAYQVEQAALPPARPRRYDVVVVEGAPPAHLPPARGYLFINGAGPLAPVTVTGTVAAPTILDWDRSHPVTRYLDLAGVRIARAQAAHPRPWAKSLAEGEGGTLIAAGEQAGVRSVYLGWDLLQSDFPLRVAFPIFISNCLEYLARPAGAAEAGAVSPGQVVTFPVPPGLAQVRLRGPDGTRSTLPVTRQTVVISDTARSGIYQLSGKGFSRRFAVNFLNREESQLRPREQMLMGGRQVARSVAAVITNKELWRWLLFAALVVVSLEWYAYHRRP